MQLKCTQKVIQTGPSGDVVMVQFTGTGANYMLQVPISDQNTYAIGSLYAVTLVQVTAP